jgi:hypothetical protein
MAFRQPTFAPPARHLSPLQPERHTATALPVPQQKAFEDSQEWVLFPQTQARSSSQTQTTYTEDTPRTAGLSRLSDFGSLDTTARSRQEEEDNDGAIDDDEELDSLDDGLQAFQEPSTYWNLRNLDESNSILPTHDGLGTFPASSTPVQEQLWRFEQYNPRKRTAEHHRRRSSVQRRLDAVTNADGVEIDSERMERIEKWRMEQSRVLLNEIEKETRRNRASHATERTGSLVNIIGQDGVIKDSGSLTPTAHRQGIIDTSADIQVIEDSESFWQRITRRVIRDLMGIDDAVLSVIFGESLPEDRPSKRTSSTPHPTALDASPVTAHGAGWEGRLLDRLARELGILVQQLSDHPGAFSTALNPAKLDYAGIPVNTHSNSPILPKGRTIMRTDDVTVSDPTSSHYFTPTLQDHQHRRPTSSSSSTHAALWGIEEESPDCPSAVQDHEYWERTPDLKTIFRFLHTRFTSSRLSSPTAKPTTIATSSTPDSLRRAAIIRQHHPLVSRAVPHGRRKDAGHHHQYPHHLRSSSSAAVSSAHWRRPESSCGSTSVRRARSGGSRNYWDLGDSIGSGSLMASMGGWGEV